MKTKSFFILLLMLGSITAPRAEWGISPEGRLDMAVLRKAYTEGEFEPVRKTLESFMKNHGEGATRDEKVFHHIYLGVIYAADPATNVRAEHHFNALLDLAPNIELVDMFIPPKIQHMFDRVKHDFIRAREYGRKYDALGNPIASEEAPGKSGPVKQGKETVKPGKSGKAWAWWSLGAAAAVGAGVGIYFIASAPDESGSNVDVTGP